MSSDSEIEAMGVLARALEPLEEEARSRVLSWANSRFGRGPSPSSPGAMAIAPDSPRNEYDGFAELFAAAEPRTDKEKALVAAYWVQVCQNQPNFPSQILNDSLKDLGHRVGNITDALDALKDEKPQLILQLKKSGTSRQARKTYKLTQEGAKRVRQMTSQEEG